MIKKQLKMQALNLNKLFKFYVVVCLLFMISMLFLGVQKRVLRVDMYGISFINVINENQSNNNPIRNRIKEIITPSEKTNNKSYEIIESKQYSNETNTQSHVSIPPFTCIDTSIHKNTNFNPFISQQELCENDFGCGMLQTWRQQKMTMCEKSHQVELRSYNDHYPSELTCYKHNNLHLPHATFPHTVCDGENIVFDFSKLIHAPCLKHRPGYFCKKPTYYNYEDGALIGNCKRTNRFSNVEDFSKDFGKDVFSSFATFEELKGSPTKEDVQFIDGVTIFVSREQDEHVNMFHSMTDFFATYIMIEMFKLNSSQVQIVLLDDHYDGPFDFLWNSVFSLKRPMMKASQFNNSTVRFERAIFQHSGYATHFLSHILDFDKQDPRMCNSKISLISSFSNRIMQLLGIPKRQVKKGDIVKGLFISRKPYIKNGIDHKYMGRQISNEEEVMEHFKTHPLYNLKFTIDKIDFATLPLKEQIERVHNSDFLIGYHGAGLTHSLWLPEDTSGVLEIWKSAFSKSWRCFEQLTLWKGNYYDLWTSSEGWNFRQDASGDYLTVQPWSIHRQFTQMIDHLTRLRSTEG